MSDDLILPSNAQVNDQKEKEKTHIIKNVKE